MLKLSGVPLKLGFTQADLRKAAAKRLRVPEQALHWVRLAKKSVDARKKEDVRFVCAIETEVDGEDKLLSRLRDNRVRKGEVYRYDLPKGPRLPQRPVVVGLGPAGLFAGLILAQCGQRPLVLERGLPVEEREKSVEAFWKRRILDPESNVQFGEGGAGAFSDGKLTTGTGDARIRKVLEELVKAGAPEEILTDAKPHIGTDRLPGVVRRIREEIIALGGEVRFSAKVTGIRSKAGQLTGLEVESRGQRETIECSQAILAVGHSARDVFQLLDSLGLPLQAKPFSVGARIEHPQSLIDTAQYGAFAGHSALGAADYKLSCHLKNGRGVYTFCMCPGGTVTGAASEEGGVVTNGMSVWARDGKKQQRRPAGGGGPPGLRRRGAFGRGGLPAPDRAGGLPPGRGRLLRPGPAGGGLSGVPSHRRLRGGAPHLPARRGPRRLGRLPALLRHRQHAGGPAHFRPPAPRLRLGGRPPHRP